jgi:formylglycine-generating enzyme required for sulfatase activity
MIDIPGGRYRMGSDRHYPEESPVHEVVVGPFRIDVHPVTNDQFAEFVDDTGYVTFSELPPDPDDYPDALPEMLYAGSMVFVQPPGPVPMDGNWWTFERGADWRHPLGADSSLDGLGDHPVVHLAWTDVEAYAAWAGKDLPTEAEWEFAARGGLDGAEFAWGEVFMPDGTPMANTWQGPFPHHNELVDGYMRTSPVGVFPPNGYGLVDMIGNVWEWTSDWFQAHHPPATSPCCAPVNPRGGDERASIPAGEPPIPRKVLKGGSHLCAPNYCQRYRPAARYSQPIDSSTSHIGFRCVVRAGT